MATKTKKSESIIEKYRDNGNWIKILEVCKQNTNKENDTYIKFAMAEAQFETHLLSEAIPRGKISPVLNNCKHQFNEVIQCKSFTNKEIKDDCELLLNKLLYFSGDYDQSSMSQARSGADSSITANGILRCLDLSSISTASAGSRRRRLLAENYAVEAAALEKRAELMDVEHNNKENEEKQSEIYNLAINSYTKSTDLCIQHLQSQFKSCRPSLISSGNLGNNTLTATSTENNGISAFMEKAITRGPILSVNRGDIHKGINRFRKLLNAEGCDTMLNVRALLSRELATVLLRTTCASNYQKPSKKDLVKDNTAHFKLYPTENVFFPTNKEEEVLLLLSLSESISSREVILNRSPEHADIRKQTFTRVKSVYELLNLTLCKVSQFDLLSKLYEKAMKFSFEEYSIWYQFALSLISAQKYTRALLVFKECLRMRPLNHMVRLLAAKICFENLHLIDEGIEYAQQAFQDCEELHHASVEAGQSRRSFNPPPTPPPAASTPTMQSQPSSRRTTVQLDNEDGTAVYHANASPRHNRRSSAPCSPQTADLKAAIHPATVPEQQPTTPDTRVDRAKVKDGDDPHSPITKRASRKDKNKTEKANRNVQISPSTKNNEKHKEAAKTHNKGQNEGTATAAVDADNNTNNSNNLRSPLVGVNTNVLRFVVKHAKPPVSPSAHRGSTATSVNEETDEIDGYYDYRPEAYNISSYDYDIDDYDADQDTYADGGGFNKCLDDELVTLQMSRCLLATGVGCSLKSLDAKSQPDRQRWQSEAMQLFLQASSSDPNDFLAKFYIALVCAEMRKIDDALLYLKRSLNLRFDHLPSITLHILLLTCQQNNTAALELTKEACREFPNCFNLLFIRTRLEQRLGEKKAALLTCKEMLQLWKNLFEPEMDSNGSVKRGTGLMDKTLNSPLGLLQVSDLHDRDNASTRAESIAASRIEQTMSGIASSMGTLLQVKKRSPTMWNVQTQIWLELANLYMDKNCLESASECINEASSIQPISHLVAFMRGRYSQKCGEINDAIISYRNALSINPVHTESLMYLGQVLYQSNNLPLAEKMLRESINLNPTCSEAWHHLGSIMTSLDEHESASECLLKSLEIEASNPIMPFSIIARTL